MAMEFGLSAGNASSPSKLVVLADLAQHAELPYAAGFHSIA
jgi:hypothetical protein